MNQNKYNRRIRLFFHKFSPSPSIQREILTSTQLNLSQFDRSKQEKVAFKPKTEAQPQQIVDLGHQSKQSSLERHQTSSHSRSESRIPIKAIIQQSKLKRGNIRQVILIDRDNFKKEDSFPLIHAKKFSIKKNDKRLIKRQTQINQQASIDHKYHSIFEPWQISEQFGDYSRF